MGEIKEMITNDNVTIFISAFSLLISIFSLLITKSNATKIEKIYYGQTELSMRQAITLSKDRLANIIQDNTQNQNKTQMVNFAIEELLNAYEEACAKYIDLKVDKKRFKKTYFDEIKNIVESGDFDSYFKFGSKYDAIKMVYNEWFNLEN